MHRSSGMVVVARLGSRSCYGPTHAEVSDCFFSCDERGLAVARERQRDAFFLCVSPVFPTQPDAFQNMAHLAFACLGWG